MVSKNVVIVTGLLAAGAAAALYFGREENVRDSRLGQALLPSAQAAVVDRVEARSGPTATTLVRDKDGFWHLDDQQGFPVDAARVVRLVDDLNRATYEMVVGTSAAEARELGLATAETVTLSAAGKAVLALKLGIDRKGGGSYLAVAGEPTAYVASRTLRVYPDPDYWELKTMLAVPKEQLQTVAFTPAAATGKKPVTLTRARKEDPLKVQGLASGAKESAAVKATEGAFTAVTFTKRHTPDYGTAQGALERPSKAVLTLFDGTSYEIKVGSVGDHQSQRWFITLRGAKVSPPLAAAAFEVSGAVGETFEKGLRDFLAAEPKG